MIKHGGDKCQKCHRTTSPRSCSATRGGGVQYPVSLRLSMGHCWEALQHWDLQCSCSCLPESRQDPRQVSQAAVKVQARPCLANTQLCSSLQRLVLQNIFSVSYPICCMTENRSFPSWVSRSFLSLQPERVLMQAPNFLPDFCMSFSEFFMEGTRIDAKIFTSLSQHWKLV